MTQKLQWIENLATDANNFLGKNLKGLGTISQFNMQYLGCFFSAEYIYHLKTFHWIIGFTDQQHQWSTIGPPSPCRPQGPWVLLIPTSRAGFEIFIGPESYLCYNCGNASVLQEFLWDFLKCPFPPFFLFPLPSLSPSFLLSNLQMLKEKYLFPRLWSGDDQICGT